MQTRFITPNIAELICEDPEKTLRRRGTEQVSRISRCTVAAAEVQNWDEGDLDPYSESDYAAEVERLIRERYTASEEFAIQRKMLAEMLNPTPMTLEDGPDAGTCTPAPVEEFNEYNAFAEQCKAEAKENLTGAKKS